jgi:penicillin-binding protein 1C
LHIKHYILKSRSGKIITSLISILFCVFILNIVFPLPDLKLYSKEILDRNGVLLTAYLSPDDKWRLETKLDNVTPEMITAIIEKEDSWFYWHPGVNPFSIARAAYQNISSGKRISGASTITMQLARLLEPTDRSYINKFIEMFRALQIELHYSKDEILEMYLSYLPMGGNIEGVHSAARLYFNRPPDKLSLSQSVALALIPNNPNKYRIDYSAKEITDYRDLWLERFKAHKIFGEKIIDAALSEQIVPARYSISTYAPHFCYVVSEQNIENKIYSTLDLRLQLKSEQHLLNHIESIKGKNITNGAILVIDNSNNEVLVYCGSADFNDLENYGKVNGVRAVRSPGSALKPFVYSSAINEGSYTPKMKLLDIPSDFAGYTPENYDQTFNGEVTFHEALINSLNVPAVRLLREIGYQRFMKTINKLGFDNISNENKFLGLSLILGGCGVTLEELVGAFTVFPNEGRIRSLKYVLHESSNSGINIFSKETAFIISDILSTNERPDFPNILSEVTKLPKIAWKTGTSYGKRDAWAIGYNKNYTIGVWVGNFNGKGSPYLSGKEVAVPLLFNLFNSIDYDPRNDWFDKPADVEIRKVCELTGLLPSENCEHTIDDYFIWDVSHEKECDLIRDVYVSENHKQQYCIECLPENGFTKRSYKFYKPELITWYAENNIQYSNPPPHNLYCSSVRENQKPKIISPSKEMEYLVEKEATQKILLQASSDIDVSMHYWYVNNEYFGSTENSGKLFFEPKEGENKIVCKNDLGAEATLTINVKFY